MKFLNIKSNTHMSKTSCTFIIMFFMLTFVTQASGQSFAGSPSPTPYGTPTPTPISVKPTADTMLAPLIDLNDAFVVAEAEKASNAIAAGQAVAASAEVVAPQTVEHCIRSLQLTVGTDSNYSTQIFPSTSFADIRTTVNFPLCLPFGSSIKCTNIPTKIVLSVSRFPVPSAAIRVSSAPLDAYYTDVSPSANYINFLTPADKEAFTKIFNDTTKNPKSLTISAVSSTGNLKAAYWLLSLAHQSGTKRLEINAKMSSDFSTIFAPNIIKICSNPN